MSHSLQNTTNNKFITEGRFYCLEL